MRAFVHGQAALDHVQTRINIANIDILIGM
jgi:hypothetical protein